MCPKAISRTGNGAHITGIGNAIQYDQQRCLTLIDNQVDNALQWLISDEAGNSYHTLVVDFGKTVQLFSWYITDHNVPLLCKVFDRTDFIAGSRF
ncbi:hypothetical protein D3C72_1050070 [compost metagenome]